MEANFWFLSEGVLAIKKKKRKGKTECYFTISRCRADEMRHGILCLPHTAEAARMVLHDVAQPLQTAKYVCVCLCPRVYKPEKLTEAKVNK